MFVFTVSHRGGISIGCLLLSFGRIHGQLFLRKGAVEEGDYMGTGTGLGGCEVTVALAGGDAVFYGPQNGLLIVASRRPLMLTD